MDVGPLCGFLVQILWFRSFWHRLYFLCVTSSPEPKTLWTGNSWGVHWPGEWAFHLLLRPALSETSHNCCMLRNQGAESHWNTLDQGGICISWAQSKMLMVRSMWEDTSVNWNKVRKCYLHQVECWLKTSKQKATGILKLYFIQIKKNNSFQNCRWGGRWGVGGGSRQKGEDMVLQKFPWKRACESSWD